MSRRIADPVLALAEAAASVQQPDDYRRQVPKREDDEIGVLTDAFNAMLARIAADEAALTRTGDRLRLALDAGRIGTCDWEIAADHIHADSRLLELLGLPPGGPLRAEELYATLHPEDRVRWHSCASEAAARLEPYTIEYRLRCGYGAARWMVEHASPRFRADGTFAGYLGSYIDITTGKETEAELEARVRLRTRQLEAANHDLGSFAYSVYHDLRAPVRLIHGFAEIALEEC